MENLSYWQKQEKPLFSDLLWNLPEQKSGTLSIVGGNSQNFSTEIKLSEFALKTLPLKTINTVLPDSLRSKLPPLPNLIFTPSTESGSFKKSAELGSALSSSDISVFLGDFSKNAETAIAITEVIKNETRPIILTRDTIDLVSPTAADFIEHENIFLVASAVQLQKLFRALYYPKVLLLSMPLLPVVEVLHKFTLSYPTTILTFHEGKILIAKNGKVISTPIEKTIYSPLGLWSGELALKIATLIFSNPEKSLESAAAAIFWQ